RPRVAKIRQLGCIMLANLRRWRHARREPAMTLTLRCRAVALSALAATSVLLAACGGGASRATPPPASTATVWLCQPGAPADPCTANLDTTVVDRNGHRTVDVVKPSGRSRFDCFYV